MNPKFKRLKVTREALAGIVKDNLKGQRLKMAEVGVFYGYFMDKYYPVLQDVTDEFHLVDLWDTMGNDDYHSAQAKKIKDAYERVQTRYGSKDNVFLHKGSSTEMAEKFEDGSLDYVYIDADHRYQGVLADITAWYPKVKSGGFICGHDTYPSPGHEKAHDAEEWGVAKAVEEFFGGEIENIFLTAEPYFMSWVYRKD